MGNPLIYKYPLDLTGINPTNLVLREVHTLPAGTNRAIVPNHGGYYSRSLVVRDMDSGNVLIPKEQFKAVQLYQEATEKTGLEVTSVVVVTDPNVSSNISIDYQAVGGEFSYSVLSLREMITDLDLDARPVAWGSLLGKPNGFPPAPHLHDAGDLYGFEYLVEAIDSVRRAILLGNEAVTDELIRRINTLDSKILPPATLAEAIAGVRDDVVLTPRVAMAAFFQWNTIYLGEAFYEHMATGNPHGVTPEQIGLGNVVNISFLELLGLADSLAATLPPLPE